MKNPYRDYGAIKADYDRYEITLRYLPKDLAGRALDVGVVNPFTPLLQEAYPNLEIVNTGPDLDFDTQPFPYEDGSFDYVFSFEVLEHLMNPLWNLLECRRVLKPEGLIFLTTPKGIFPPTIMWPDTHFHEIDRKRFYTLTQRAGLEVQKLDVFNKGPLYWWRMGIFRPTLRVFLGGWFYTELRKA